MSDEEGYTRTMTPVRVVAKDREAEVIFLESAQFYHLPSSNPKFDSLMAVLRDAVESGNTVEVTTRVIESNVIEAVEPTDQ